MEPGVKFSCDIDYDAFKVMQDRDLKYGFTVSLREMPNTMPTLWANVIEFMNEYPQYLTPKNSSDSLFAFVSQDDGVSYNRCHFWSNFEVYIITLLSKKKNCMLNFTVYWIKDWIT